jgi:hypothetical protein
MFLDRLRVCFDQAARIPKFANRSPRGGSPEEEESIFETQTELLEYHAREYTIDVIRRMYQTQRS